MWKSSQGCPWPQLPPGSDPQAHPATRAPASPCGPGPVAASRPLHPISAPAPAKPGRPVFRDRGSTVWQRSPRRQCFWRRKQENRGKMEIFSAESWSCRSTKGCVGPAERRRCWCLPIREEPRALPVQERAPTPPVHLSSLRACCHPRLAPPPAPRGGDSCSPTPCGGQSRAPRWGPEPL